MTVTFTPSSVAFGNKPQGVPKDLEVSVKNEGAFTVALSTTHIVFTVSPAAVDANKTVKVKVTFTAAALESYTAQLKATENNVDVANAALSGTGVAVSIEPPDIAFGQRMVGGSEISSLLVTNTTSTAITVSLAGTGYSIVDASGNPVTDLSVPAGQGKTFLVKFSPPSVGTFSGTFTAPGAPAVAALTGEGVAATLDTPITEEVEDGQVNRLYIDVPNKDTQLTMGRGINGTSYDGFGVSTTGDIFLNAIGDESKIWLQSRQDLVAQSFESNVQFLAKSGWSATAGGTIGLVGGGGVTIAAGFGDDPIKADASNPPDTSTADSINSAVTASAITAAAWDTLIGFGAGVRAAYGVGSYMYKAYRAGKFTDKVVNKLGLVSLNTLGALGGFGTVALNVAGLATGKIPGISMFALGGLLVGTPAYGSVYAAAGLVLSSLFPFVFGLDCEVMGLKSVTISGYRNATVQSHSKTTVHSDGDVEISADGGGGGGLWLLKKWKFKKINRFLKVGKTKEGIVTVRGNQVLIGKSADHFDDPADGDLVAISAKQAGIQTGTDTGIIFKEDDWGCMKAADNLEIRVGNYVVMVKTDKIQIGKSASANLDDPPADPILEIDDTSIELKKATSRVVIEQNAAELASDPNTRVVCDSAQNAVFIVSSGRVNLM